MWKLKFAKLCNRAPGPFADRSRGPFSNPVYRKDGSIRVGAGEEGAGGMRRVMFGKEYTATDTPFLQTFPQ